MASKEAVGDLSSSPLDRYPRWLIKRQLEILVQDQWAPLTLSQLYHEVHEKKTTYLRTENRREGKAPGSHNPLWDMPLMGKGSPCRPNLLKVPQPSRVMMGTWSKNSKNRIFLVRVMAAFVFISRALGAEVLET